MLAALDLADVAEVVAPLGSREIDGVIAGAVDVDVVGDVGRGLLGTRCAIAA
jgi:hypothetical protein